MSYTTGIHARIVPTVDFAEHPPHLLDVIQIQEERLRIPLILLKWHSKSGVSIYVRRKMLNLRVGAVDGCAVVLSQQNTQHSSVLA